jgi:hypothetical protein
MSTGSAILRSGPRHEAERERESHTCGKHTGEFEKPAFRIIVEFGTMPSRRLDDRAAGQRLAFELMWHSEKIGDVSSSLQAGWAPAPLAGVR